MPRVDQEALETFMRITGVTAPVAVQKLEEHSGDLNAAVNSHFAGDRSTERESSVAVPQDDFMEIDDPVELLPRRNPSSLFSEERREVWQIPIEVKVGGGNTSTAFDHAPVIEDVTGTEHAVGPDVHGIVIVEDEEETDETQVGLNAEAGNEHIGEMSGGSSPHINCRPSAPEFDNLSDYGNDVEEQMVRAAIEASKREAQGTLLHLEDAEIAHAVSLSLKTAEHEKALRKWIGEAGVSEVGHIKPAEMELGKVSLPKGRLETGSSSIQDEVDDVEEQPLLRNRSWCTTGSLELMKDVGVVKNILASSPIHNGSPPQHKGKAFTSDEANMLGFFMNKLKWVGISSEEHDEAVMLEAALFGRIPEGTSYRFHFPLHQFMQPEVPYAGHVPCPPSPSLQAQRLIQEQQDGEFVESLAADQEKEIKALEEAEARRLQEEVARKTALEEETQKEEEFRKRLEEEQELERQLAEKEASLPHEPASDDETAVTLLVRMPNGIRRGRRFLKSDNLQSLFDFIDIGRLVKPGTYRLVRPYPRRAFSDGESGLTLKELGLKSKQEALFLELKSTLIYGHKCYTLVFFFS